MKDKEMAEEYLDEKCKDCYMCSYSEHKNPYKICQRRKDRKQAFLAGLKAGRPQWHDLRKDPNDLPKDITSLYLVRVYSWDFGLSHLYKKYGMYIPTVCEWNGEHFKALNDMAYSNARNIKSCIAWKEIVLPKERE